MKLTRTILFIFLSFFASTNYAHHPAADIVDSDIYAMIDDLVSDTPHSELIFDDMGSSMQTTISSDSIVNLDNMLEDGLISYIGMLEGNVSVNIDFNDDRSVTLTITQSQ